MCSVKKIFFILFILVFFTTITYAQPQDQANDTKSLDKKDLKEAMDKTLSDLNALNDMLDKSFAREDAMAKEMERLKDMAMQNIKPTKVVTKEIKAKESTLNFAKAKTVTSPAQQLELKTKQAEPTVTQPKYVIEVSEPLAKKHKVIRLEGQTPPKETSSSETKEFTQEGFDKEAFLNPPKYLAKNINKSIKPVKVYGTYKMEFAGQSPNDFIWKKADADWAEKNWRYIDANGKRENMYDPAIYSQLVLNTQTESEGPLNTYMQFVVDPWSFVGTTAKDTLIGSWGDRIEDVKLKYWSNSGMTIAESYRSSSGNAYSIPELKVHDDKTTAVSINSAFRNEWNLRSNISIPSKEIDMEFKPIRKLWVDFTKDKFKMKVFGFADQSQALVTDDPLRLSDNRVYYWQASPWIYDWKPGQYFTGNNGFFRRGRWDDTLAHRVRDSDGNRLTLLRGVAIEADYFNTNFKLTAATPLGLWDDYNNVNNIPVAMRTKTEVMDKLMLGSTLTFREGFRKGYVDVINYVSAFDAEFSVIDGLTLKGEFAMSETKTDMNNADTPGAESSRYDKRFKGQAAKASLSYSFKEKKDSFNVDFSFAHMGEKFNPTLSDYRHTRDDQFWSRHVTFQERSPDIEAFRMGDGMDTNRNAWNFKTKAKLFNERLDTLFHYRNVYRVSDNKYIESVFRNETTYKITPKLTSKFLFVYQDLPQTVGDLDPGVAVDQFLVGYSSYIWRNYVNDFISDNKNPSNFTGSGGLRYEFTPKVAGEVIYERTNYYYFPHGILNDVTYNFGVFADDGDRLDNPIPFLYDQNFFPLPFCEPHNIYQLRCELKPLDGMIITIEHVRNGFKYNVVDETMNHNSLDVKYDVTRKLSLRFNYTYSRVINLFRQVTDGQLDYASHHNVYTAFNYKVTDDTLLKLEYGVGPTHVKGTQYVAVWQMPTLDTQHIIRATYSGKF